MFTFQKLKTSVRNPTISSLFNGILHPKQAFFTILKLFSKFYILNLPVTCFVAFFSARAWVFLQFLYMQRIYELI